MSCNLIINNTEASMRSHHALAISDNPEKSGGEVYP
jgi:hypothetical protein